LSLSFEVVVFSQAQATAAASTLSTYTQSATFLTNLQSASNVFSAASSIVVTSSPTAVASAAGTSDDSDTSLGLMIGISIGVFCAVLIGFGICTNLAVLGCVGSGGNGVGHSPTDKNIEIEAQTVTPQSSVGLQYNMHPLAISRPQVVDSDLNSVRKE